MVSTECFMEVRIFSQNNCVKSTIRKFNIFVIFIGKEGVADGYALWKNRQATEMVNEATKNLPPTEGPSHFVLTAHEELPKVFPTTVCNSMETNILSFSYAF